MLPKTLNPNPETLNEFVEGSSIWALRTYGTRSLGLRIAMFFGARAVNFRR